MRDVDVTLKLDGTVEVDGKPVIGRWHHVQLGAAYFEDEGVWSTDVMPVEALKDKLADVFGEVHK